MGFATFPNRHELHDHEATDPRHRDPHSQDNLSLVDDLGRDPTEGHTKVDARIL
jgi:hypothetical protein